MKSIKKSIITVLLIVIAIMTAISASVIFINMSWLAKYNDINENITYEQELKDNIELVAQDWYNGSKSGNYDDYYERLEKIRFIRGILDSKFIEYEVDQDVKIAHRSLNTSLDYAIEELEKARRNLAEQGQILGISTLFAESGAKLEFVQQNITSLLIAETRNIAAVTDSLREKQLVFFSAIIFTILAFSVLLIILSLYFAGRISWPITSLSAIAQKIAGGNLDIDVGQDLLKRNDEVGGLAKSFNLMLSNLKEKVALVEYSNTELNTKIKELMDNNKKINRTKLAMTNLLEDFQSLNTNLKEERDRSQVILSSMGEGLLVVDDSNKIAMANPAAAKLLKTAANLADQPIQKAFPLYSGKDKVEIDEHPVTRAIKSQKVVVSSLEDNYYIDAAGRRIAIFLVVAPLIFEGKPATIVMFRDASEEKTLDEAKIGFISVASHQLRTPLTSIRWFSEMLMDGDAGQITQEQKEFVERIYYGTERMINLVNLLLQIARVEAGRLNIVPVAINFQSTTNGVVSTIKSDLVKKSQEVVINTGSDPLPTVLMDQEVIWQVIQNLMTNASRYSPEKSTITVSVAKKDDYIEYSVKDQGIGIPKEYQPHIFEKFYRADNALKYVPEGSGLGLSLVKMLVERWGGKIWFESQENKGTTFYFTVPLKGMKPKKGDVSLKV